MEQFALTPYLLWLLLALILGGLEILTLSFFLLWPALAALIVAVITFFFPSLAPAWQIVLFAVLTVLLLIPGRRWVKKSHLTRNENIVNERGAQMIGKLGTISSGADGIYRVKMGDGEWSARGPKTLKRGEQIRVTAVDGITLKVEAS